MRKVLGDFREDCAKLKKNVWILRRNLKFYVALEKFKRNFRKFLLKYAHSLNKISGKLLKYFNKCLASIKPRMLREVKIDSKPFLIFVKSHASEIRLTRSYHLCTCCRGCCILSYLKRQFTSLIFEIN